MDPGAASSARRGPKRRSEDPDPAHTAQWYREQMKDEIRNLSRLNKAQLVELYNLRAIREAERTAEMAAEWALAEEKELRF